MIEANEPIYRREPSYVPKTLIMGGACLLAPGVGGRLRPADQRRPVAGRPDKAAQAPEVPMGQPVVQTVTDYEDFTGHTEAVMSVEIRARVSGYLVEGLKDGGPNKEGTEVKKGELALRDRSAELRGRQGQGRGGAGAGPGPPRPLDQGPDACRGTARRPARSPRETTTRSPATTRRRRRR